jgi:hypothetical protein
MYNECDKEIAREPLCENVAKPVQQSTRLPVRSPTYQNWSVRSVSDEYKESLVYLYPTPEFRASNLRWYSCS